ncbi:meprin A subunit beta-like [Synchiropus splendidus]|uniref:meprin A subunit beta-like n=1 Tax=Synchiropus splendidus TaxID=270530 RepID=UPI00237E74BC|nr:meprin A subunit beta-like [Synchiropus splendidus]
MQSLCFWMLFLGISSASSQRSNIMNITEEKDITEVNKNLTGDDILQGPKTHRSSITDTDLLWDSPVPYILHEGLELNAKGVILRALDQFRLKSCIDFTVRETQDYFIHVQKLGGCFSYVGQRYQENGQTLSIGQYCDTISTGEHEFLHALGFYHEQSRPDRDDFVTIVFKNIQEGRSHNFDIAAASSTQGVPYDYWSVMHYGKNAFSNGNGSTIITEDPKYQDVIGQRQAMSPRDVEELNLRYDCNDSVAFQLYCDFSDGAMCHMTNCSGGSTKWERVTRAEGGPSSDHTSLPSVTAEEGFTPEPPQEGHFMHVSTAAGEAGDSAWLETPRMKPKRQGHLQCLQFYYFHNGSADDQLNIWIREFNNETNTARLMGQVTGPQTSHWRIHHVSLDAQSEFQVEFEVQKGNGSSSGGISIDDINLSEIQCPDVTMQIDDFEHVLTTSPRGTFMFSPRHYSSGGYAYRFAVELNRFYFGLRVQLLSGQNDDELTWPCLNRQVTLQVVDQTPNIQQHMSRQRSFTTDLSITTENGTSVWDNPRKFAAEFVTDDGEEVFGGPLVGLGFFWYLDNLKSLNFLKGESAVFAFDFQDITPLINGSSLPKAKLGPTAVKLTPKNPRHGTCKTGTPTTAHPTTAHPTTAHPTTAHPTRAHPTTVRPTTDKRTPHTVTHRTTVGRTSHTVTQSTTAGRSASGFSAVMMSSPILVLLSAVLLWIA